MPANDHKPPVDKFIDGKIHVSIFENDSARGMFRAATLQLRYKNGDEWQTGTSYGVAELKQLERAAREARVRIQSWQAQQKAAATSNDAA
jgi:hypothetical protein